MSSYWDRTDERRRLVERRQRELAERQIELWGWSDQRLRDGTGRLLRPKKSRGSRNSCEQRDAA